MLEEFLGRAEHYKSIKIDEKDMSRELIKTNHPNLLEIDVSNFLAGEVAKIIIKKINEIKLYE